MSSAANHSNSDGSAPSCAARSAVLVCIDGWGLSDATRGNAIRHASTPVMDAFAARKHNYATLDASGLAVGLPEDVMGNSEVGHLTIGAGRPQYQDLVRIDLSIKDGSLGKNATLNAALDRARSRRSRIHLLGLLSDGGVHSHQRHLYKLLELSKAAAVEHCFVHCFMDGRDTDPRSGRGYVRALQSKMRELDYGTIATCTGRYYAMDRDKRWERVEVAVRALVDGAGEQVSGGKGDGESALLDAIQRRYDADETDEFLTPLVMDTDGCIRSGDTLLFFDFRSDRMREIVETIGMEPPYETAVQPPSDLGLYCMTQYSVRFPFPVLFPQQKMDNVLAEWISKQGMRQYHTAETEKYAHVTFFFNGGVEAAFPQEDRNLVASPKVPTYDRQPRMSQDEVGESMVAAIATGAYPFIMCNLAAPDMVGHTGVYDATVEACEDCDRVIGRIWQACREHDCVLFVTADHGNAETMLTEDGNPVTSHTTNWVPLVMADPAGKLAFEQEWPRGTLADVAPTLLRAMGIAAPKEMSGNALL